MKFVHFPYPQESYSLTCNSKHYPMDHIYTSIHSFNINIQYSSQNQDPMELPCQDLSFTYRCRCFYYSPLLGLGCYYYYKPLARQRHEPVVNTEGPEALHIKRDISPSTCVKEGEMTICVPELLKTLHKRRSIKGAPTVPRCRS